MNQFLHYTISDFLEEDSFIRWVRLEADENDFDWESWLMEHPEKREIIDQAKSLILHLKFKEEHIKEGVEDSLWAKIDNNTKEEKKEEHQPRIFPLRTKWIAIAASLLLLIAVTGLLNTNSDRSFSTSFAEVKNISLPDGSVVSINSKSKLNFNKKNWENNRVVYLEGEAFFEVKRGSKFLVNTKNGNVEVLGTSFNVFSRDQQLNVICKTGKVRVFSDDIDQVLMPNQATEILEDQLQFIQEASEVDHRESWMNGLYVYTDEPLIRVIHELERQLDFEIVLPEAYQEVRFTGSFNSKNNKKSLSEVLWPLGLKYEIDGRKVIVSEE